MKIFNIFYCLRRRKSNVKTKMFVFITILFLNACIAGTIPATPENITVTFLTPTTVRISWQTMIDLNAHPVEKYIVTYKPTDDRVVQDVAGNSEAIILDRLSPSTQYSIAVTAIWLGKKYRSRQIIFRTLDMPKIPLHPDSIDGTAGGINAGATIGSNLSSRVSANSSIFSNDDVTSTATNTLPHGTHRELPTIRGVEIGIVLIVLMVWAGAIALFFNRWGKIRMLLPYQPDYKHEQLKVPGTGVCGGGVCNGQHSHQFDSSECGALTYQPLHCNSREEHSASISERCTRSRINSAIFVSSEGRGFDSIEFLRRHGSQSVLCRKARSAENITDNGRKKSFSENKRQWCTDENAEESKEEDIKDGIAIELQECRKTSENRILSVLKSNADPTSAPSTSTSMLGGHSAAVTTANKVVGSISIEAPPAFMKDSTLAASNGTVEPIQKQQLPSQSTYSTISSTNSASHDSTDTVEELILVPATEIKSRVLIHQCSSNASSSPHSSPKSLTLKGVKNIKPKISALPMVSVSEPTPTQENPPPTGCL